MSPFLAKSHYQELLGQITDIYRQAQTESKKQMNIIITDAYWRIGRQIVDVEQGRKLRADYGEQLVQNLSKDLTEQLGTGFSVSNLRYMRQFYISYPKHHARGELPWTHYRSLLSIKDSELRDYYEKQASEHKWSSRDLDRYLKLDKVEREKVVSTTQAKKSVSRKKPILEVNRGDLYTFSIINAPMGQHFDSPLMIDCGFQIFKEMNFKKIGPLKSGDIVNCKKTETGFRIKRNEMLDESHYTYKAIVERVIDGDTLLCLIDAGFNNWTRQRLRLRGIDTPEIKTSAGQKAKHFVQESLTHCPFIVVKTFKTDKYDRYIADIFYLNGIKYPSVVIEEGRYLNQDLLDNNLARKI